MNREDLIKKYSDAAQALGIEVEKEEKTLLLLSVLRFLCFAGGAALTIFLFVEHYSALGIVSAFLTIIMFMLLLKRYSSHTDKLEFLGNLSIINRNEAGSLKGDFSVFLPGNQYSDHSHDFSYDVDLFGDNSIFQYLNRTVTGYGRDILAGWLADPYNLTTDLKERQEIVRELASKVTWRQEFMAAGMKVPLERDRIEDLTAWLREDHVISSSSVKKVLIFILPAVALLALSLVIAGLLHYSVFITTILLNLGYVGIGLKTTNRIHNAVSGKYVYLSSMKSLLKAFGNESFAASSLKLMKEEVAGTGVSAAHSVKKLERIIQSFDSRMNLIVGFGLNALLLWDYHCIRKIEKWKKENKDLFPLWLEVLGKIDAYSSFGNYAFNNAGFCYPSVSQHDTIISSHELGHPLIDEKKRVCNEFTLTKKGTICIITGANMAGKSTFLRTVAVNYILAMAGAPVCAKDMSFRPVRLFTSMRTTDSLAGNESYFYAELKRLRSLKNMIAQGEPVLFILDEILKGTNSADKTLGSRLFIKNLIPLNGTGLIATHDISLGDLEQEHPGNVFNMCFEIEINGEAILFDYKLQRGITKKMNAALLMRQMGILD